MRISLATWNVNSVRAHMEGVRQFCTERAPDVICLQETKVDDSRFPLAAFSELGYAHQAVFGQKSYHGVAIFAKAHVPLQKVTRGDWCGRGDARHLSCIIGNGIELHNFYVPAGGDVPDREKNEKFGHKLDFMTEVAAWFGRRRRRANGFLLVGDLNVAPLETDVWSHKQLLKVVSHTAIEVEHMARWYASHDWVDAVRRFVPPERKLYSWWSYRSPDWAAADKGRRLDHVWATPSLAGSLRSAEVYKPARAYPKASDHAPVLVELEI